jgi:hypothetical protein
MLKLGWVMDALSHIESNQNRMLILDWIVNLEPHMRFIVHIIVKS